MKSAILLFLFAFSSCADSKTTAKDNNAADNSNFIGYVASLKLPENLSFCGEKVPLDNPEVRERAEREFYLLAQQPGQLVLYIKRAGRYFPMYQRILKEENVPDDLKYLSVAESALYMARSAKDAVGLWQFIPGTARAMGLQVDESVDERRHPEKSTRAAIQYLRQGYNAAKSWTLAAAGYNMGHENLQDNLRFQSINNFYDLYLNEETSRYVLRIALIKEFLENGAKYGLDTKSLGSYPEDRYKTVRADNAIPNLAEWARSQGTNYKDVKMLNPWILKRELPAPPRGKSWEIAVPAR